MPKSTRYELRVRECFWGAHAASVLAVAASRRELFLSFASSGHGALERKVRFGKLPKPAG
jgi:hypothetical protein